MYVNCAFRFFFFFDLLHVIMPAQSWEMKCQHAEGIHTEHSPYQGMTATLWEHTLTVC